jgi:hypothetical protein
MNYSNQYDRYLITGKRVPRQQIGPYGLYRISTYKYSNEGRETLRGVDETIIFVTGIYQKKVSALKLSNIKPIDFFLWFRKLRSRSPLTVGLNKPTTEAVALYELSNPLDRGGLSIYNSYIKNNKDFVMKNGAYRTYNLNGIQYITELKINSETVNKYYG